MNFLFTPEVIDGFEHMSEEVDAATKKARSDVVNSQEALHKALKDSSNFGGARVPVKTRAEKRASERQTKAEKLASERQARAEKLASERQARA